MYQDISCPPRVVSSGLPHQPRGHARRRTCSDLAFRRNLLPLVIYHGAALILYRLSSWVSATTHAVSNTCPPRGDSRARPEPTCYRRYTRPFRSRSTARLGTLLTPRARSPTPVQAVERAFSSSSDAASEGYRADDGRRYQPTRFGPLKPTEASRITRRHSRNLVLASHLV